MAFIDTGRTHSTTGSGGDGQGGVQPDTKQTKSPAAGITQHNAARRNGTVPSKSKPISQGSPNHETWAQPGENSGNGADERPAWIVRPSETKLGSINATIAKGSCPLPAPIPPVLQPAPMEGAHADSKAWKQRLDERLSQAHTPQDFDGILKGLTSPELRRYVIDRALSQLLSQAWKADDFVNFLTGVKEADLQEAVIDRALQLNADEFDRFIGAQEIASSPGLWKVIARRLLYHTGHVNEIRTFRSRLDSGLHVPPDPQLQKKVAARCAAAAVTVLRNINPWERTVFLAHLPTDQRLAFALGGRRDPTPEQFIAAMQDLANDNLLSNSEQIDLFNHASPPGLVAAEKLAEAARNAPECRSAVAEWLLRRAAELQRRPKGDGRTIKDPHIQARFLALDVMKLMRGQDRELGLLIANAKLTPDEGVLFAKAVGGEHVQAAEIMAKERNQLLAALIWAPASAKAIIGAMVNEIWAQTLPGDLAGVPRAPLAPRVETPPELIHNMAMAMACYWCLPDNPDAVDEECKRLEALLQSIPCRELLFGGSPERNATALEAVRRNRAITPQLLAHYNRDPATEPTVAGAMARVILSDFARQFPAVIFAEPTVSIERRLTGILRLDQGQKLLYGQDDVPLDAKAEALGAILFDIQFKDDELIFSGSDPWRNHRLITDIAQARAAAFRSDEPVEFQSDADLQNFVGYFLNKEPIKKLGAKELQGLIAGTQPVYQGEDLDTVVKAITVNGGPNPSVTALPITFSSGDVGPIQFTLFRVVRPREWVLGPDGSATRKEVFVDHQGRVYQSFEDWKKTNGLPSGIMVYPKNGHIETDPQTGMLVLEAGATEESHYTVKKFGDHVALAGGLLATGFLIVGTERRGSACADQGVAGLGALSRERTARGSQAARPKQQTFQPGRAQAVV